MRLIELDAILKLAKTKLRSGQVAEAEAMYRQVLKEQPESAEALHFLGLGASCSTSWGDGTVSRSNLVQSTFTTNHQYNEEGDYEIEVDAIYYEKDTDSYQCQAVQHDSASVRPGNPTNFTMGVSHVSWSNSVGVGFIFADADGDNPTYTVNWGDGSTDTGTQQGFSHTYAYSSSGKTYSITGSGTTDDGTFEANSGTASIVSIDPTTLSLSGGGVAYEHNQQPAYLYVNRTGDTSQPLSAALNLGGTEESSEYQLIDPDTGQNIGSSVTIPAKQSSAEIEVIPLEDNTPEWTDTIDATIAASGNYDVDPNHNSATISVADNDLGVKLGNGSGNIILQGSSDGKQNPVTMTLKTPSNPSPGATITLTELTPGIADVWDGSTQILGSINGQEVSSYTWTGAAPPKTLQVYGTNGSQSVGDLRYMLEASDTAANPAGVTSDVAQSNSATVLRLQIAMWNDPNSSGDLQTDIANQSRDWLIGQLVDIKAVLAGPKSLVGPASYLWGTPPGNVAHNIQEPADAASRKVIRLSNDNAYGLAGGQHASTIGAVASNAIRTGLEFQEINFFWISTSSTNSNVPDTDVVSVNARAAGMVFTAETTFNVYAPSSTVTVTQGAPGIFYWPPPGQFTGWMVGLEPTINSSRGINWFATVQEPTAAKFRASKSTL